MEGEAVWYQGEGLDWDRFPLSPVAVEYRRDKTEIEAGGEEGGHFREQY